MSKHGPAGTNRRFLGAILFVGKTGLPWRDLPERFGHWNGVWKRFDRWSRKGVWQAVFDALQDSDLERLILDSTVIRAHPCAAGVPKTPTARAGKRSKPSGGAGAGERARVGNRFVLSPGQEADITHAPALLEGAPAAVVIADKGTTNRRWWTTLRAKAERPWAVDADRYKDRNLIERFWSTAKQYRRVATRYEKTARNFLAFVHVASIMILLR